jgi:protein-S-isoprenylcysteine O-methyltransferase Ste14
MYVASLLTLVTVVSSSFLRQPGYTTLRVIGACCGLAAIILMSFPIATLKKHGDVPPGGSYMQTARVVDRGLFALTRHPQYLGYVLFCTTFALLAQHWLVAGLGILAVACFYKHSIDEEQLMVAKFGEAYRDYMMRVPRFNILLGALRSLRR